MYYRDCVHDYIWWPWLISQDFSAIAEDDSDLSNECVQHAVSASTHGSLIGYSKINLKIHTVNGGWLTG